MWIKKKNLPERLSSKEKLEEWERDATFVIDRINPMSSTAYRDRAVAKYHLGRLEDAIKDLDEAVSLADDAEAYFCRAKVKQELGYDKEEVFRDLSSAEYHNPSLKEDIEELKHNWLGRTFRKFLQRYTT